jgi:hypothetical protein
LHLHVPQDIVNDFDCDCVCGRPFIKFHHLPMPPVEAYTLTCSTKLWMHQSCEITKIVVQNVHASAQQKIALSSDYTSKALKLCSDARPSFKNNIQGRALIKALKNHKGTAKFFFL